MRVTNSIITRNSQLRLQASLQEISRIRDDIASGVRIRRLSDEPTTGGELVRIGSTMRALTQFRRNATAGTARAQAEEGVLNQLSNVLTRGSELAIGQIGSPANAHTRNIAKAEVDQLLNLAASLGNTRFGDGYLFGGNRSNEKPLFDPVPPTGGFSSLELNGNPVNPSGGLTLEIGDNKFITPNHNATEVFIDSEALDALRDLSTALGSDDSAGIQAAAARLDAAGTNIQTLLGAQGARINEMEGARVHLDTMEYDMTVLRSDLRDTEVDKALVDLLGKQTLYQAAMSATSRILGLSLANYL